MKEAYSHQIWGLAICFYGITDFATTVYLIQMGMASEGNPLVATVLEITGLWILLPWKAAAIGLFYGLYRVVPEDIAIGVPIGLAILGVVVTIWNTSGAYLGHNPLPIF